MKILAMLYMLTANGPEPVAAYFTQDAQVICQPLRKMQLRKRSIGVSELLSAFRRFAEAEEWPKEIEHLKGKVLSRKKDGAKYRVSRPSGQYIGRKPAAYLAPVGDNWPIISRSHWKTYAAILKDFTV